MAHQRLPGDTSIAITDSSREAISDPSATFNPVRANNAYAVRDTPPTSTPSVQRVRKRKHSKAKAGKSSRSMSTPQMQGPGMSDSDIDKKGNKLGYQRISIACAHCRRRKIRCMVDENDPQQRCQNCIRLKKECLFYPVEQQGAMEERSQSSSKAAPSSTVSSSPGDIGSARSFDEREGHNEFPTLPSNMPNSYHGMPLGLGSATYNQASLPASEYDHQQPNENRSPWVSPSEFDTRIHAARPPAMLYPNQHYLHFSQVGSTGDFAPFPLDPMQQPLNQHDAPTLSYAPQRGDPTWQQPLRSVPYGHIARSMPNSDADYGGGYHLSRIGQGLSPLEMHNISTVGYEPTSLYAPGGQHQNPFPSSTRPYNNSMMARSTYSDNLYFNPRPFEPARGQDTGTPSEDATEHQRR